MADKMDLKLQEFKKLKHKIDLQDIQKLESLIGLAREKVKAAARIIKEDFGASRVILYGSLATGHFKEGSDIDLLISGFTGSFWNMYIQVEEITAPIPVSVICLEDASESLIAEAYERGVEI